MFNVQGGGVFTMESTFKFFEPKIFFNVKIKKHLKILNKRYSSMFKVIKTNFDNFGVFFINVVQYSRWWKQIQGNKSKLSINVQCPGDGGMDGKWEECKHSLPRPWQVEQYDLYYWQAGQILTK